MLDGMAELGPEPRVLTRQEASDWVFDLGWRYVLGMLLSYVPVGSLSEAARAGAQATEATGMDADEHLSMEILPDRLMVRLQTRTDAAVTTQDVILADRITAALRELGLDTIPTSPARSVQAIEIAVDALDIAAIRPFWKAVTGYDEGLHTGPADPLVDPLRQGPAIWFQQMDAPRPQRNRIHLDISVPHDVATRRVEEALAAGGSLLSDAQAPRFWVLADSEGNEACVTTWQGRD